MKRIREFRTAPDHPIDVGRVVVAFALTISTHVGLLVLAPSVLWWFVLLWSDGAAVAVESLQGFWLPVLDAVRPLSGLWPIVLSFLAIQIAVAPLTAERLRRESDSMGRVLAGCRKYLDAGRIRRVLVLLACYVIWAVLLAVLARPLVSERSFWDSPIAGWLATVEAAALLFALLAASLVSCLAVTAAMLDGLSVAQSAARSLRIVGTCWPTLCGLQLLSVLLVMLVVLGLGVAFTFVWVLVLTLGREVFGVATDGAHRVHAWVAQHSAALMPLVWSTVCQALLVSGVTAAAVCYWEATPAPPDDGDQERPVRIVTSRRATGPLGLS